MGSKRSFDKFQGSGPVRDAASKRRKPVKDHTPRYRGEAPPGLQVNKIKKRARDIERQFTNGVELPADRQRELERELAHCKRQIEGVEYSKQRNQMISRYHKVRFFDRQKADRLKKQLKKRLDEATDAEEKAKLAEDYHVAEVDSYYPRYFPFMEPYEGLYTAVRKDTEGSADVPLAQRALHAERPPMWKEIEEALAKGRDALESIQERRPKKAEGDNVGPSSAAPPSGEASGKKARDQEAKLNKTKEKKKSEPARESRDQGAKWNKTKEKKRWEPAMESEPAVDMHEDRRRMLYGKVKKQPKEDSRDKADDDDGFFEE